MEATATETSAPQVTEADVLAALSRIVIAWCTWSAEGVATETANAVVGWYDLDNPAWQAARAAALVVSSRWEADPVHPYARTNYRRL